MTEPNATIDLSATDARYAINAGAFTPEQLADLRKLEESGKARKTVLAAIDAQLAPPPPAAAPSSTVTTSAPAADTGKPPHKPNCEVPDRHDGAPCTNCGVSEIVWDGGAARCTYCNYRWQ